MPDHGEWVALQRLDSFVQRISDRCPAGAHLILFSDGRVYCDIFKISDVTTSKFRSALREIYTSSRLHWADLDMFLPQATGDDKREALMKLFGETDMDVQRKITTEPDFRETYCGFKKFMEEEHKELLSSESYTTRRKYAAAAAKKMMARNVAYRVFVSTLFPRHIRLSIHPCKASCSGGGEMPLPHACRMSLLALCAAENVFKFGVNLVGRTDWGTPWHNVVVETAPNEYELVRRAVAEERGYSKHIHHRSRLPYFVPA